MTKSFSFLDSYLNSSVVWRPTLGEEAEGGVEPHHVVSLEAVLEGSDQQRLVGVRVPPASGGQTLAGRRYQGQVATTNVQSEVNYKISTENSKGRRKLLGKLGEVIFDVEVHLRKMLIYR